MQYLMNVAEATTNQKRNKTYKEIIVLCFPVEFKSNRICTTNKGKSTGLSRSIIKLISKITYRFYEVAAVEFVHV